MVDLMDFSKFESSVSDEEILRKAGNIMGTVYPFNTNAKIVWFEGRELKKEWRMAASMSPNEEDLYFISEIKERIIEKKRFVDAVKSGLDDQAALFYATTRYISIDILKYLKREIMSRDAAENKKVSVEHVIVTNRYVKKIMDREARRTRGDLTPSFKLWIKMLVDVFFTSFGARMAGAHILDPKEYLGQTASEPIGMVLQFLEAAHPRRMSHDRYKRFVKGAEIILKHDLVPITIKNLLFYLLSEKTERRENKRLLRAIESIGAVSSLSARAFLVKECVTFHVQIGSRHLVIGPSNRKDAYKIGPSAESIFYGCSYVEKIEIDWEKFRREWSEEKEKDLPFFFLWKKRFPMAISPISSRVSLYTEDEELKERLESIFKEMLLKALSRFSSVYRTIAAESNGEVFSFYALFALSYLHSTGSLDWERVITDNGQDNHVKFHNFWLLFSRLAKRFTLEEIRRNGKIFEMAAKDPDIFSIALEIPSWEESTGEKFSLSDIESVKAFVQEKDRETFLDIARRVAKRSGILNFPESELKDIVAAGVYSGCDKEEFEDYVELFLNKLPKKKIIPMVKTASEEYCAEVLRETDKIGPFLGLVTNCCQHLHSAAKSCAISGYKDPDKGFVVWRKNGDIVAQSFVWVHNGVFVFDSIESKGFVNAEKIAKLLVDLSRELVKDPKIKEVRIGDTSYGLTPYVIDLIDHESVETVLPRNMLNRTIYTDAFSQVRVVL